MANKWNIPDWLEQKLIKSQKTCAFCRVEMKDYSHTKGTPGDKATWEHLDNDEKNISQANIVRCCSACNSSKGAKPLSRWLESDYCKEKSISRTSITNRQVLVFLQKNCP